VSTVASRSTVPRREDLKLALLLGALSALATALLFPYLMLATPDALAKARLPLSALVTLQAAQAGVLLGILAFCGLRMGHAVGLGAPWLRALLFHRPRPRPPWLRALAAGLAAGIAIVALDAAFAAHMPALLHARPPVAAQANALAGFLASFYGGIAEEVQLRLFLMTLVAWALTRLGRSPLTPVLAWVAIVIAALAFGAGHLPAAAQVWPLDAVVIVRTVLLNGVGGLVFGWLFWKHGLAPAMLAHFGADLVLHVLAPLAMA
jgi:hypothetical protein